MLGKLDESAGNALGYEARDRIPDKESASFERVRGGDITPRQGK